MGSVRLILKLEPLTRVFEVPPSTLGTFAPSLLNVAVPWLEFAFDNYLVVAAAISTGADGQTVVRGDILLIQALEDLITHIARYLCVFKNVILPLLLLQDIFWN